MIMNSSFLPHHHQYLLAIYLQHSLEQKLPYKRNPLYVEDYDYLEFNILSAVVFRQLQ